jgi:outer membrane protein assembly factor BamA
MENSRLYWNFHARASGIDILRFYGFGNETSAAGPDTFFKVEQDQLSLEPWLVVPLAKRFNLSFGPVLKFATTEKIDDRFIGTVRPYGVENFGQVGTGASLKLDTRDTPGLPLRGVLLSAGGSYYPAVWDVASAFGEVHAEATTYLGARVALEPTLVLRGGGKRVWGTYPFHEAAFLGGGASLRGLRSQRYAGDASLYASAEVRLSLTKAFILVPGELGVFGLGDIGRVYLEGETSDRWHHGLGGGLYFASPNRKNSLSAALARSEGRTGFYLKAGLAF